MRRLTEICIALWLSMLLSSCAAVSVVDTWRNPDLRLERPKKVLVVAMTKEKPSRTVYEDMLVSELSRNGVAAVAGHTVLSGDSLPDWGVLDRAVRRSGADAVMTVQTVRFEKQTTVHPTYTGPYPGYWYPSAFPAWDFPGYYRSMALHGYGYGYGPTYISTYDIETMQVNLFDAGSDKLLWAATVQSNEPEKVTKVGQDLARKVVTEMKKDGML